jgi:amino acid adenylation domain-containing protein
VRLDLSPIRDSSTLESLWTSFARRALADPGAEAVAEEQASISYGELAERATALQELLDRVGARQTPVGLLVRPGIAYIAAALAATAGRAIFAPLDADWPESRSLAALRLIAPSTVVTTPDLLEPARALVAQLEQPPHLVVIDRRGTVSSLEAAASGAAIAAEAPDDQGDSGWAADSLYLLHTSGSTGVPNAVEGAHRSLAHFIAWQARAYDVGTSCRVAQLAPTTFDVSLRDIFLPLCTGGCVVVPDRATRRNPIRLRQWLSESGVNLIHAVPSVFKLLVEEIGPASGTLLPAVEKVFFSGERLYVRDAERFREALPTDAVIANFYGPSECTLIKTHFRLPAAGALDGLDVVPIGWPIDQCSVHLSNGDRGCDEGEVGEIRLRSDFLAKGYFRNAVLTARRFTTSDDDGSPVREYRTGDLGYRDAQGCLHFVGRRDDQVKINGNRVELGEVEHWVRGIDGVTGAAVLMVSAPDRDPFLACAYAALRDVAAAEVRAALARRLPSYMVPTTYMSLDRLPLLASGKVDRKALAERLGTGEATRSTS